MGVAPIPGPRPVGKSTFVGGDAIGIGVTSTKAAQAWELPGLDAVRRGPDRGHRQEQGRALTLHRPARRTSNTPRADPRIVTINGVVASRQDARIRAVTSTPSLQRPAEPTARHTRGALFGDATKALARRQRVAITKSLAELELTPFRGPARTRGPDHRAR